MTFAQIELLRELIAADRRYHALRAKGASVSPDDRGVEVCAVTGVNPRTARSLVDAGLAEMLDIGRNSNAWLFLGSAQPLDDLD